MAPHQFKVSILSRWGDYGCEDQALSVEQKSHFSELLLTVPSRTPIHRHR